MSCECAPNLYRSDFPRKSASIEIRPDFVEPALMLAMIGSVMLQAGLRDPHTKDFIDGAYGECRLGSLGGGTERSCLPTRALRAAGIRTLSAIDSFPVLADRRLLQGSRGLLHLLLRLDELLLGRSELRLSRNSTVSRIA